MFTLKDKLVEAIELFVQKEYVPVAEGVFSSCYVAFGCMDCSNYCAERCSKKCKENAGK